MMKKDEEIPLEPVTGPYAPMTATLCPPQRRPKTMENKYMRALINIVPLLLVSLLTHCQYEFDNPAEYGALGAITGQVVRPNALTVDQEGAGDDAEVPVQGAVCTLEGTNRNATTDANGDFVLSQIADGAYILICRHAAASGASYAALVAVEVTNGQTVNLGTILATAPGSIEGVANLIGQSDHTGIVAFIPGTSMSALSNADGFFHLEEVPEGTYTLRFEKDGFLPIELDDIEVVGVETTVVQPVTLALSSGPSGTIVINGGAEIATSRSVSIRVEATDVTTLMVLSADSGFVGAEWVPIAESAQWSFTADGAATLFAKFSDANGLESQPVSDSILIDTLPPMDGSVIINNGAAETGTREVSLTLSATDIGTHVQEVLLANDAGFTGAAWQAFAASMDWTLTEGDGSKTVFARFRDAAGHESDASSDTILLDTSSPLEGSIWLDDDYTNATEVTVHCSAVGATTLRLSWDEAFTDFLSYPYATTIANVPLPDVDDGTLHLYAQFFDAANNPSDVVSASLVLDTILPTRPFLNAPHPATPTSNDDYIWSRAGSVFVPFSTPSSDTNLANYRVRDDFGIFGQVLDPTIHETAQGLRIVIPDATPVGTHKIFVAATDLANNVSNETWFFLFVVKMNISYPPTGDRGPNFLDPSVTAFSGGSFRAEIPAGNFVHIVMSRIGGSEYWWYEQPPVDDCWEVTDYDFINNIQHFTVPLATFDRYCDLRYINLDPGTVTHVEYFENGSTTAKYTKDVTGI